MYSVMFATQAPWPVETAAPARLYESRAQAQTALLAAAEIDRRQRNRYGCPPPYDDRDFRVFRRVGEWWIADDAAPGFAGGAA